MFLTSGLVLFASSLLTISAPESMKEVVSSSVRAIRAIQNPDGSYGPADAQPQATCAVLEALGSCREHYTTQDGPFVRDAVSALLSHQMDDGGFPGADSADRVQATDDAIRTLTMVAKVSDYDASRERAQTFLDSSRSGSAGPNSASTEHPDPSHLAAYLELDPTTFRSQKVNPEWLTEIRARLLGEQSLLVATLTPESLSRATAGLLALNELEILEKARNPNNASTIESGEATRIPVSKPPDEEALRDRMVKALTFLGAQQINGRFGFGEQPDPGITAIALSAIIKTCDSQGIEQPPFVEEGLDYLASLQKADGGIYSFGLKNYVTSASVEALVASGDLRYEDTILKAVAFLTFTQLDDEEGYSAETDPYYGGFGYGSSERPDLSNTQMALQALHDSNLPTDHEAYQKAITFLQRCQNRKETGLPSMRTWDDQEIVPGTDGGAVYRPGDSKAGTESTANGQLVARSYGSMTYALLKSYLFAGLEADDPRVQEAVEWIGTHYTLDRNPGFHQDGRSEYQGLFYYYLTMARALQAIDMDQIEDATGSFHDWRQDLRGVLFGLQNEEGAWANQRSSRWMEGNPVLATAYALLALEATNR